MYLLVVLLSLPPALQPETPVMIKVSIVYNRSRIRTCLRMTRMLLLRPKHTGHTTHTCNKQPSVRMDTHLKNTYERI